jgi:hypothetical protein
MTDEQLEILVPYVKAKINKSYKPYKYEMNHIEADKQTENLRKAVEALIESTEDLITQYGQVGYSTIDYNKSLVEQITGKKYEEIGEDNDR